MSRPDFFLVGAPKSGTTAIDSYLGEHPEVFMCPRKETHFFARDLAAHYRTRYTTEQYLSLFDGAGPAGARRVGESSVWYLYSQVAADAIAEFEPRARIVIMLRNPVDMIHSFHSHSVYMGREPVEDFERAVALDEQREAGLAEAMFVPTSYRAAVRYPEQVERYLDRFGRDRVHVTLFEDFAADPAREFRELCRFLGVADDFTPSLRVINASRRARNPILQRLTRRPPERLRSAVRMVSSRGLRNRVHLRLVKANTAEQRREPMSAECRARLERELAPEVERLSALLDSDLSAWSASGREGRSASDAR